MNGTTIDLHKLTLEELSGVVNIYPWFAAARRELCLRMGPEGLSQDGGRLFAEAALYVPCRRKISEIALRGKGVSASAHRDTDVEELLKSHAENAVKGVESAGGPETTGYRREVRLVGGDYFSQSDYASVKENVDTAGMFKNISSDERREPEEKRAGIKNLGVYTETLAAIYAEQGYFEEAKSIYSQLILAYPEKSAYFASLIEKLDER